MPKKGFTDRSSEAARLVEALLSSGMTATDIGGVIHVGERSIYRWRNGSAPHPLMLEGLRKLANKRGVS